MASEGELVVERIWAHPAELSISFLHRCCIYLQLRNKLDRSVRIKRVECHFSIDRGMEPYVPVAAHLQTLAPGQLSDRISIEFEVDLALSAYTNAYRLTVEYEDGTIKRIEHDPRKYLVFTPLGPGDQLLFISHKDPEDTRLGGHLVHFLKKIGFTGYMSEVERRPGSDLWGDKIPRAIKDSLAIIFLWTRHAADKPDNLFRELEIANGARKPVIVAIEPDIPLPAAFSKDREYYRFNRSVNMRELKDFVLFFDRSYRQGDYL